MRPDPITDWRLSLADYHRAKVEFARAERLLANALVSYDAARRAADRPMGPLAWASNSRAGGRFERRVR